MSVSDFSMSHSGPRNFSVEGRGAAAPTRHLQSMITLCSSCSSAICLLLTSGLVVRHYGCPTASDAALCPGWLLQRSLCVRVRHGPPPTTKLLQVGVHHSAGKHPLPPGCSHVIQSTAARPRATAPFANGHRTHQARSSTPSFGFLQFTFSSQQQDDS